MRGREWIVLPSDDAQVLRLRPLTGADGADRETGIFLPLEGPGVRPAIFAPPDPDKAGDITGALLLRDAARLSLRASTAPFRSLGHIAFLPRPYQHVPLMMALRLDPVRLLIADDVGVGKTIEAGLVARELLDRGVATRLAVICPSHLCDQWEGELADKFGIEAAVVQPSRIARLERELPRTDLSIYQHYPHLILSIDFAKSERHRDFFLANAPDLVIVDEAHIASRPRGMAIRPEHQRHELIRDLMVDSERHLILVTATPHSGIEESYRSLLGFLDPEFDWTGEGQPPELDRRRLLPHVVLRRRKDLSNWVGAKTPFPERESEERRYSLSDEYRALFEDVLRYCRQAVQSKGGLRAQQQRVRHWAAIALLRCVLSSPEAAASVLANRATRQGLGDLMAEFANQDEVDATYRPQVLDELAEENLPDYLPTSPLEDAEPYLEDTERRQLGSFLRRAKALAGGQADRKLMEAARATADLLKEGYRPIIFCRFIATARYVADQLPALLGDRFPGLVVRAITSEVGEEERRAKVQELAEERLRVLVATDCLSEGINLQEQFDAVLHYDLPWNPNRLEQREGRVDRFGQEKPKVKAVLLYGADNHVDLVVLNVLIEKARTIRRNLGISVPVPIESEQVIEAVVESILLRGGPRAERLQLELGLEDARVSRLHASWEAAAERESRLRAYFAQEGIRPDEVAREMGALAPVLGDAGAVQGFVANVLQRLGGELRPSAQEDIWELWSGDLRPILRSLGHEEVPLRVRFDGLAQGQAIPLHRTHPLVAALCQAVLDRAFAPQPDALFARAGATFTDAVRLRTGVALLRLRYRLKEKAESFAEEVVLAAFERREGRLHWLEPVEDAALHLVQSAVPRGTMPPSERREHVDWALGLLTRDPAVFDPIVDWRTEELRASHARARKLVKAAPLMIEPHRPPDILGVYVLVPSGGGT